MADETDTLAEEAGTDNVNPSQDDTAPDWDYYDPDEDQDTVADPEEEATEDEAGEPEDTPEEESEEEPDQTDEKPMADENAVVRLADGTETTVAELTRGYLRQADFTRKTQEVAERRKAVAADAERAQKITEALIDRLTQIIPDPPDPSLAYSNPNRFTAMKAQHDAAVAEVQKLIEVAQGAKQVTSKLSDEDRQARLAEENMRLIERFPEVGTADGRKKFFNAAAQTAMDLGFTQAEIQGETDHRMFALAHYAKIGMEAEKAKASAKAKVAKVAPTPPKKPGQGARPSDTHRKARERFEKNPTLRNAAAVPWD